MMQLSLKELEDVNVPAYAYETEIRDPTWSPVRSRFFGAPR